MGPQISGELDLRSSGTQADSMSFPQPGTGIYGAQDANKNIQNAKGRGRGLITACTGGPSHNRCRESRLRPKLKLFEGSRGKVVVSSSTSHPIAGKGL